MPVPLAEDAPDTDRPRRLARYADRAARRLLLFSPDGLHDEQPAA